MRTGRFASVRDYRGRTRGRYQLAAVRASSKRGFRRINRVRGTSLLLAGGLILGGFAAPATSGAAPVITNWYRLPAARGAHGHVRSGWFSSNWSGYAETGHFTSISSSWTVPSVTAGASTSNSAWFSSAWVGIDGFNDTHLIQTGTEQDVYGGSAHYSAWWEILPKAESPISYPVSPGDSMSATITQTSTAVIRAKRKKAKIVTKYWTIGLQDHTKGWSFVTTQVYKGPGDSAEFIVEAPLVGRSVAAMANYNFGSGSALNGDLNSALVATTIGGAAIGAGLSYSNDAGTLFQNGVQVSTPGPQDSAATAFNSSYGATEPAAPVN